MSDYRFAVLDVAAEPYAMAPQLTARLGIEETTGQRIHAITLRCQVRIEPQRRRYDPAEEERLRGLFGERERWADTVKPFQWMQCHTTVQGFTGRTEADLALPCTYDLEVIGSRYLHALDAGDVPLTFLFSGTVFTRGSTGFGVEQIPWSCEARHSLPVAVWRQMIESYYPNTGWLRIGSDVLTELAAYRARHGLVSWDETMQKLLTAADGPAR
ncbi:DUF6084 family protein [Paractinoplanes brasiliensis]|uniref:Uncharacterized protein n=1 Tax=Paractinoplanes brasiliensis TaxID=52695 RepID=A0A4R6JND2_9ACTN|nr:DUF6084 family protein [Actinoplanes brasiliensis]TDO36891.1 hypothetical protein C8E87_0478 [Actinoplanes brasiliensis]GID30411.1 hypothetical protein Abr02nite_53940 [Actinoplanes brasiliensis]